MRFSYKAFSTCSVLLLLCLLIAHMAYFEYYARVVLLAEDVGTRKYHEIEGLGEQLKVVAIGTSHTEKGLVSQNKEFYNYGRMMTWYPQVAGAKVKHVLDISPNLKTLILEVDHLDVLKYNHHQHTRLPKNHTYLLQEEGVIPMDQTDFFMFLSLQNDVAPVIHKKLLATLEYRSQHKLIKSQVNMWTRLTNEEKESKAVKRVKSQLLNIPRRVDENVDAYYQTAIAQALTKGIKVYLILYPQTKEYFQAIHPSNHKTLMNYIHKLKKNYNIKLLDYRNLFSEQEGYFMNQDHLSQIGSESLSAVLFQELQYDGAWW